MFLILGSFVGSLIHFISNNSVLTYSLSLGLTITMIFLMGSYDNKLRLLKNIKEDLKIKSLLFTIFSILISLHMGVVFDYLFLQNLKTDWNDLVNIIISNAYKLIISMVAIIFYTLGTSLALGTISSAILKLSFLISICLRFLIYYLYHYLNKTHSHNYCIFFLRCSFNDR